MSKALEKSTKINQTRVWDTVASSTTRLTAKRGSAVLRPHLKAKNESQSNFSTTGCTLLSSHIL